MVRIEIEKNFNKKEESPPALQSPISWCAKADKLRQAAKPEDFFERQGGLQVPGPPVLGVLEKEGEG